MTLLTNELSFFSDDSNEIIWDLFFYESTGSDLVEQDDQFPYTFSKWELENMCANRNLAINIIKDSSSDYRKKNMTLRQYTPNNEKNIIDYIPRDSPYQTQGISLKAFGDKLIDKLREDGRILSNINPESDYRGYVFFGNAKKSPEKYCILIGIGRPYSFVTKNKKFLCPKRDRESTLEEVDPNFIQIKMIADLIITDQNFYLTNTYAQNFLDLDSFHQYNKEQLHQKLQNSPLISNFNNDLSVRKQTLYSIIQICCGEHLDIRLNEILDTKKKILSGDPSKTLFEGEDNSYSLLELENNTINIKNISSYKSLLELLSFSELTTDHFLLHVNALNAIIKNRS